LKRGKKGKGDDDDDDEASDDDSDTSKLEAKLKACNMPPESAKVGRRFASVFGLLFGSSGQHLFGNRSL
jgi:hypothetical protein